MCAFVKLYDFLTFEVPGASSDHFTLSNFLKPFHPQVFVAHSLELPGLKSLLLGILLLCDMIILLGCLFTKIFFKN